MHVNVVSPLEGTVDRLLNAVAQGAITPGEAVRHLSAVHARTSAPPLAPEARLDVDRESRTGMPEVIFAPGKTNEQLHRIAKVLLERSSSPVLATKASPEQFEAVRMLTEDAEHNATGGTIVLRRERGAPIGTITIVTAGTSDIPVAEEAATTADACGAKVERIFDVGVAGIHRILSVSGELRSSDIVIVAAGMEGALPSVVGGMVRAPVIAVPTSIGYGASFHGVAALLGMMNSCAPGVAVVNIDNGFGAAAFAVRLLKAFR